MGGPPEVLELRRIPPESRFQPREASCPRVYTTDFSPIVGVQRYILQLGNAWRVTQNTQAEPLSQRSHHDEFFLPVEQT